jgi:hypothetical protein
MLKPALHALLEAGIQPVVRETRAKSAGQALRSMSA